MYNNIDNGSNFNAPSTSADLQLLLNAITMI